VFDFHPDLTRLADIPNLLNILFLGVGASAVSFLTWNYAVRLLGPVKTSIYIYIIPIITILMSAIVLREPITWMALSGVALILLGLYLSERKRN
jgi:drug/metabolite transporter (DMT)-like permease